VLLRILESFVLKNGPGGENIASHSHIYKFSLCFASVGGGQISHFVLGIVFCFDHCQILILVPLYLCSFFNSLLSFCSFGFWLSFGLWLFLVVF
jgi:hypothetical protein